MFALIVLILGIYWYANTLKYIKSIRSDVDFIKNAGERYLDFASDGRDAETRFKIADILVVVGFVFFIDFTINLKPVLPAFVATFLLCAACFMLRSYTDFKKLILPASAAVICQIAFEFYAAHAVDPTVFRMSDIPVSTTVTLSVLGVLYAASSVYFLLRVEAMLAECRLKTTELSPLEGWRRLNVAYYIFLAAYLLSLIFPMIGGWLLWIKLASELTFVIGCIICWNKSIRVEE